MASAFTSDKPNGTGDRTSSKEMNPAANSTVAENKLSDEDDKVGDASWREGADDSKSNSGADDPGRTPGKAEGDEDFDTHGNNS